MLNTISLIGVTGYWIDTIFSPDDRGYYTEVVVDSNGETVYTTPIYPIRRMAQNDALVWVKERGNA